MEQKDGTWPEIYAYNLQCDEPCVIRLHHYFEKHHIEVNHQVYAGLLVTESGHELDKCSET